MAPDEGTPAYAGEPAETLLRHLLDSMLEPFVLLTAVRDDAGAVIDFEFTDSNPAAQGVYQMSHDELNGQRLLTLHPAARKDLFAMYVSVIETGMPMVLDDWSYPQDIAGGEVLRYDVRGVRVGDSVSQVWRNVTQRYLDRQRITESERNFRLVAENASDVVFQVDAHRSITWVSPAVRDVLAWDPAELIDSPLADLIHPSDLDALRDLLADELDPGTGQAAVARWRTGDGAYRWMLLRTHPIPDHGRSPGEIVVTLLDYETVTEVRHELAVADALFEALWRSPSVGMMRVRADGCIQSANAALAGLLDRSEAWLLGHRLNDVVAGVEAGAPIIDPLGRVSLESEDAVGVVRLARADGGSVWARWWGTWVPDGKDTTASLMFEVQDISGEHEAQEELAFRATHDALTGLANRTRILELLEADLAKARLSRTRVGVLFLDLDHFKVVNDSLGHAIGDEVLAEAATRMASTLGPGEHIGRLGGDEFLILLPDVRDEKQVEELAHRIDQALRIGVRIDVHVWPPLASIGIALSTPSSTAGALLREADSALFRAKATGRGRWQFFDEGMHTEALERLTLEDELRESIARRDFHVYYQPIVSLADLRVVGHEALVRWEHPRRGLLTPADFLSVAEQSGLIREIDTQVLEQVCRLLQSRDDLPGTISVNKSPVEVTRPGWLSDHLGVMALHGVDPRRICIELTETAVLGTLDTLRRDLLELRRIGVDIHVDDFGTGYSSIALLRDLPVTGLKLDLSFTKRVAQEGTERVLAAGLAALVQGLGISGVAEGVEEEAQATVLRGQGWTHGQGWLFGRAAPEPVTNVG